MIGKVAGSIVLKLQDDSAKNVGASEDHRKQNPFMSAQFTGLIKTSVGRWKLFCSDFYATSTGLCY